MSRESVRFLKKLVLFGLPFALAFCVVAVIDPYNYFAMSSPVADELKREVSYKLNYAMWKMFEYRADPVERILLGDSRMLALRAEDIEEMTGERWYNFAYGGGSLREALATFDFALEYAEPEEVVIGLDLNTYNASDTKDRVTEVYGALANPFLYVTNNNVLLATGRILGSVVTGREPEIGKPLGDRDEFWRRQIEVTARNYYAHYRDPVAYREGLRRLAATCRERGIALTFIILPTHQELMDQIDIYGIRDADVRMRDELAALAPVYDFAWPNAVTADRANFRDPYHFTREVALSIMRTVFDGTRENVRISGPATP